MDIERWRGKVTKEHGPDLTRGGSIVRIAEELDRERGFPEPVPGERWVPCGIQPFLRQFLQTFGDLIEDEPRQRLLDFLPRVLTTHEFHRHGVNNIAEERRCSDAARSALLVAQKALPSPALSAIDTGSMSVGEIVNRLYGLDKAGPLRHLYETWWAALHCHSTHCATHSAHVFAGLDVEAGMRFLDRAVEPYGYKAE